MGSAQFKITYGTVWLGGSRFRITYEAVWLRSLWRLRANVTITDLEEDRFVFGFDKKHERNAIIRGGPWLYNKQLLLVLEEMDDILQPLRIPLLFEEFWIQLKGLSMCYMTREMGKFIENLVGEYVVACMSK